MSAVTPLLDLDGAAEVLGISSRSLRRYSAAGAVKSRRMGRRLLFAPEDLAKAQRLGLPSRTELGSRSSRRADDARSTIPPGVTA